jgi:hypothetical protein
MACYSLETADCSNGRVMFVQPSGSCVIGPVVDEGDGTDRVSKERPVHVHVGDGWLQYPDTRRCSMVPLPLSLSRSRSRGGNGDLSKVLCSCPGFERGSYLRKKHWGGEALRVDTGETSEVVGGAACQTGID